MYVLQFKAKSTIYSSNTPGDSKFTDSSILLAFVRCMEIYCHNTEVGNHNGLFGYNDDEGLIGKGLLGRMCGVERVLAIVV